MTKQAREKLRGLLNRCFSLGMSPLAAAYHLERRLLSDRTSHRLIDSYGGLLSLAPGFSGDFMRRAFYQRVLRHMHGTVTISQGVMFSSDDVELDEGVYIGGGCIIGRCRIGRNTLLGDRVVLLPGRHTHQFSDEGTLIEGDPRDDVPIHIGQNSWIGAHAVVMADVGARSTIGAGSVVVKAIPDDSVAVGNPARVVRQRQQTPAE